MNPLDHPICLASPKRLTSVRSWHEHIPFAMFLVDVLRPRVLVELGTHAGDSYCAFCQAVRELSLDTRCYAVDTWKGDAHSGLYDARVLEDLRAHHDPLYGSFSTLIQSTFDDALCHFADGGVNLLHIDGYHTYEAVKRDFELWLPKMSADGIILFHDTNVRERDFGISRFWSEIKKGHSSFEFHHGHGLGVLAVGETVSEELQSILDAGEDDAVRIRDFFFQLGQRLSLRHDIEALQRHIVESQNQADLRSQHQPLPTNHLQVFWVYDGGFTEAHSIETPFTLDDAVRQCNLPLPPAARGPLRLDPGNQPCYIEISRIELYAGNDEADPARELLATWSQENDFGGLTASSGIVRISGPETFRFVCIDEDPQLLLEGMPERNNSRPWLLRVTLRSSERFLDSLAAEIDLLQREIATRQLKTTELETELANSQASVVMERKAAQTTASSLAALDREFKNAQILFGSERMQFLARIADKEEELQSRSKELNSSRASAEALSEKTMGLQVEIHERTNQVQALNARLHEKEATEKTLRATLSHAEALAETLRLETTEQRELINSLVEQESLRTEAVAQTIHTVTSLLDQRERELERITRTLGWRLLNLFGPIKYGILMPAYRSVRSAWEVLLRPDYRPAYEPIHHLRALDGGGWESTGQDPQFNLAGTWPQGWAEVFLYIKPEPGVTGRARLYVDRGNGYQESDSYDLGEAGAARKSLVPLGPEVSALRLDPLVSPGRFRINKLVLKPARFRGARKINPVKAGGYSGLKQSFRFARARAASFREKNGRAPTLLEIPAAISRTLRAWKALAPNASVSNQPDSQTAIAPSWQPYTPPRPMQPYDAWLEVNEWNARRDSLLRERLSAMSEQHLLSVVMPVHNPTPELLDKAIASVAAQVYQKWELCIADDASTDPAAREVLQRWAERESRIRIVFRKQNGDLSRAINSAAELARGNFLALMDQHDEITPDAIGEVALCIAEHPDADVLYTDDDNIDVQGQRFAPQFKPDWSPDLLLAYMYISHLVVLRKSLFFEAGGLRVGYEGAQDFDLALRVTEIAGRVEHIPKLLYHRRVHTGSASVREEATPESAESARRAVQEALERRGVRAKAYKPNWADNSYPSIFAHEFPDDGPRIAIIIPTRNNLTALTACIESLEKTSYKNYEVVIVDNESDQPETLAYLSRTRHKVLRAQGGRFSEAAMNNRGAQQVDADCLLFLHDDTKVIAPEWLSQMAGYLTMTGVGATGARLRSQDGSVRHAGIVHGYYNGMAGPAFKMLPAASNGYLSYTKVARNYSAVSTACLLTWKELFLKLGGFDEQTFAGAYSDVDFCYRLRESGHRVVYCAGAELIDHDNHSPGLELNPVESSAFRRKYGGVRDPFYNPNLSLANERFAIDARTLAPDIVRPIRVAMCAFTLNREGAPYSQFELTVRLKETGVIDPIVYCPQEGPLRAAYEEHGIRVDVFAHPLAGVYDQRAYDRAIANFSKRIEDWNADLVYANTRQTFYAIEAAKLLGQPSIWNPRESEPWQTYFDYLGPDISARALQCFSYPYKVIFVADASRESCSELNVHHNFTTIHNGLDRDLFDRALERWPREKARRELTIAADETAILLLGTVCERKGQIDLVKAVGHLSEQATARLRCFIVGDRDNDYSAKLRTAIKSLPYSRESRITLVPETSDAAIYYAAADAFVCTSRVESFPRVILEAMAAGLPIITTPVYGIAEQVRENVNALFYQPGDSVTLAERIEKLQLEAGLRQRLAGNSRHVLDTLIDFDAMVSSYGRIFREAWLSGRSR